MRLSRPEALQTTTLSTGELRGAARAASRLGVDHGAGRRLHPLKLKGLRGDGGVIDMVETSHKASTIFSRTFFCFLEFAIQADCRLQRSSYLLTEPEQGLKDPTVVAIAPYSFCLRSCLARPFCSDVEA